MTGLRLGGWAPKRPLFRTKDVPVVAGISGGRTSAMMAALCDEKATLAFMNTGREHPNTLEYLRELDAVLGGRIVWLEFRKPKVKGAPPRMAEFAVVSYATADRSGRPFEEMLEMLAEFRATKGEGPLAPWARQRLCTAYLKQRVQEHYARSLGLETYEYFVGLRHDEPERVFRIKDRDTQALFARTPLYDAGITKGDVLAFWQAQSFNLRLEEHQGNCTGCFLKDQGDLARVLMEPETDAAWWLRMERTYKDFGGRKFPGYASIALEAPDRLAIERALRAGEMPAQAIGSNIGARRHHLLVLQEKRRLTEARTPFSCSCEQSYAIAADEEDTAALAAQAG